MPETKRDSSQPRDIKAGDGRRPWRELGDATPERYTGDNERTPETYQLPERPIRPTKPGGGNNDDEK